MDKLTASAKAVANSTAQLLVAVKVIGMTIKLPY